MPAPAEDIMLYAMEHSYSSAGEIKRQTRIGNSQKNKKYMCIYIFMKRFDLTNKTAK